MSKQQQDKNHEKVIIYPINDLVADRFSRYAKYIILDRALPDVRDGLKPVHRRILYAMHDLGLTHDKSYKKSARVIGEVIGKYHPHGDVPVYGAMVRMAQSWKSALPLVDMQGNKGSVDGDSPAAMRYTEVKLAPISQLLLKDLRKEVVPFILNFDEEETEPTVLPSYFPNILVNGSSGIAIGVATNIPPHNLGETIKALIYRINNPNCSLSELLRGSIKGPDFPTGGIIEGLSGIREAYTKGKGRIAILAKTEIEKLSHAKQNIIIHELPYEVVKQEVVKRIEEVRALNKIHGIKEVRDETDRDGMRIVVELMPDANAQEVLNYLLKNTNLKIYYNLNLVAIANNRPQQLSLLNILDHYLAHQITVITARSQYELKQLSQRLEIIKGLVIALDRIDEVIKLIRISNNRLEAKTNLMTKFLLSDIQAEAIVQLRLYRLTATDAATLVKEKTEIETRIGHLQALLADKSVLNVELIQHLTLVKTQFSRPRRSVIAGEIQDIVVDEKATLKQIDLFVTISYDGWIKAINTKNLNHDMKYHEFGRKPNDVIVGEAVVKNLDNLLVFTNQGNYLVIPGHKLIEGKWKDVGVHINTICKLDNTEKIVSTMVFQSIDNHNKFLTLVTKKGLIKRIAVADLATNRLNRTIRCMGLHQDDEVVSVALSSGQEWVIITSKTGFTVKYLETSVNILGTQAKGIRAIKLATDDEVIGMALGLSDDIYGVITNEGTLKRTHFNSIVQVARTTKGHRILPVLKSRKFNVASVFKANQDAKINFLTNKERWYVTDVKGIPISRPGEGNGKAMVENIVQAKAIHFWDLRTIEEVKEATFKQLVLEVNLSSKVDNNKRQY